jgi:hypothetical protein
MRISPMASLVYGDKTAVIMTDGMSFTFHVTKDSGCDAASPVAARWPVLSM